MINEKEILWNQTLKLRNALQQKCLYNKHSWHQEIKIYVPEGFIIETVIGGRMNGQITTSIIHPDEDLFSSMANHVNDVNECYAMHGDKILKDVK